VRVVLLAGGNTVYLYAPGDAGIDDMAAVLYVAYPAGVVTTRTVPLDVWELARPKLIAEGVEIVDRRFSGGSIDA